MTNSRTPKIRPRAARVGARITAKTRLALRLTHRKGIYKILKIFLVMTDREIDLRLLRTSP